MVYRLPIQREPRRPIQHGPAPDRAHIRGAQAGLVIQAVKTVAAIGRPVERYVIPRLDAGDTRPNSCNLSGAFVSGNNWQRVPGRAGDQMPIAVADPGCRQFHQDFACLGRGQIQSHHLEGGVYFKQYSCINFHGEDLDSSCGKVACSWRGWTCVRSSDLGPAWAFFSDPPPQDKKHPGRAGEEDEPIEDEGRGLADLVIEQPAGQWSYGGAERPGQLV